MGCAVVDKAKMRRDRWSAKNPDYQREYYQTTKHKRKTFLMMSEEERQKILDRNADWVKRNPHKKSVIAAKYRRTKRQKLVDMLGGKCVRCGFSDIRALQVDHVNGGGIAERRTIGWNGIENKIFSGDVSGYQLLCANCNQIKKVENKENGGKYI